MSWFTRTSEYASFEAPLHRVPQDGEVSASGKLRLVSWPSGQHAPVAILRCEGAARASKDAMTLIPNAAAIWRAA